MPGATAAATAAYRAAHADLPEAHFRTLDPLAVASIGLGTYLGVEDDRIDRGYGQAIVDAVNSGCNLLDTAINYRAQRSERVIGQALVALEREGGFTREQFVVCTKGGYIPFDGGVPVDPGQYVRDTYVRTGILQPEDVVGGGHAMTPRYLEDQLGRSLRNLGLAAVDVYYVHNPETQLGSVPRKEFLARIQQTDLTAQARELFENDLKHSRPIELAEWHRSRTFWKKLAESWAYFILTRVDPHLAQWELKAFARS